MKKLKLFGAAVIAASLILSGCAPQSDDETTTTVEKPGKDNNGENSGGDNTDDNDDNNGGEENGDGEDTGDNEGSGDDNDTTTNPKTDGYTVTFSDSSNSSSFADGVYTVTVANANDSEWGNQIFIKDPNKDVELVAGDKIHATITLEADKEIATMFVKDQFNGVNYSGIDTQKNLPANTKTVFDIYGSVANDYDETAGFVLALRGNEAETTLKMSNIKVEKLGDYVIESISIKPETKTIKEGETITFDVVDQYGFSVEDALLEITSENVESILSGKLFTAASANETVSVKASYESFEVTATITVEKISAASESWGLDLTNDSTSVGILPIVNVEGWGGANTAPVVEEFAGKKAIKLTIPESYPWIGVAWQNNPNVDTIDVSGYESVTLTFNDSAFAEGEALTDYNLKLKGGIEVPLKGTVSAADSNGWKTITISLKDYADAGVSLSAIGCINFCDWKAGNKNPSAGALYVSELKFNPAE